MIPGSQDVPDGLGMISFLPPYEPRKVHILPQIHISFLVCVFSVIQVLYNGVYPLEWLESQALLVKISPPVTDTLKILPLFFSTPVLFNSRCTYNSKKVPKTGLYSPLNSVNISGDGA